MKINKFYILAVAALGLASCGDIDEVEQLGAGISLEQDKEAVALIESRATAKFNAMFTFMGKPYGTYTTNTRADDFGFIMAAISQDAEGPDLVFPNSGYNWFSVCGELSSRTPDYANPYIRYSVPYTQIKMAHDVMSSFINDEAQLEDTVFVNSLSEVALNMIAQSKAIRAYDYMALAPAFQFSYAAGAQDAPCVPIVTLSTPDATHNPRVSVKEVYDMVIKDLTWAIDHLTAGRSYKNYINKNVALGLRARAYLATEQWALAAADAEAAAQGFEPASIDEVSTPAFYDINDHNWMWGYDMINETAKGAYATWSSWLGAFSANSYACGVGVYAQINNLLFDKIPATDVRKGWWVDANMHSDLLSTIEWDGVTGDDIATLQVDDVKEPYLPYTNVKFGANKYPTTDNDEDFPFMRVEEMILIQVEGLAKSGKEAQAKQMLENFVKTYRDPAYTVPGYRSFADEIWFQRRVELWGEGFAWSDLMRLNKPLVRFHEGKESNQPDAFMFNLPAKDGWMLMRFPQTEMNTNLSVENNKGGSQPTTGQNGNLRDGVTD